MKRLFLILALLALRAAAQTTTPNLGMTEPAHGTLNWDTQINGDLNILDAIFPLPTCGDALHATSWNASTKVLGCQTINGLPAGFTLNSLSTGFSITGGTTAKTLTVSNTLILTGTDGSTLNIGVGGTLGTGAFANIANYLPLVGGTLTGKLVTVASATGAAGFNVPPGTAPTSPNNGDVWSTSAGFFGRAGGATVGPFGPGGGTSQLVHGLSLLMAQPSGNSICNTTPTTSLWATDIQPTFFPGSVMTHIKYAIQTVGWNGIQTGIGTFNFSTFNTNCLANQFGASNMAAIFQNEDNGGTLTNVKLPGWYNSIVSLNTCARATTTTGNCVSTSTTPLFTFAGTPDKFCVAGTTLTGATTFNDCGYTVTAVSTSGANTTISWSHGATANGTDTATGGFVNDFSGAGTDGAGLLCGNQPSVACAGLVISTLARSGTCPGAACVVTATVVSTKGSIVNSIPASPAGSYLNDQIQISGSQLTGSVAFDGIHVVCTAASGITGCINPTATQITWTQPLAANNTDTAVYGFLGNPIVSDVNCHPHTQATKWIQNYVNAQENFWTAIKANEDGLGLRYIRAPWGIGGENRLSNSYTSFIQTPGGSTCDTDLLGDADVSTPVSDIAWQYTIHTLDTFVGKNGLNFATPLMSSMSILQSTDYQNADTMVFNHIANGLGIGSQALNNTDLTTWASGTQHYGIGNDNIWNFQYCQITTWCEGQGVGADDATGANNATVAGNGQITLALNFYLGMRMGVYECFFSTCLSAFDPNWCPWTIGTCTSPANNQANFQNFGGTILLKATSVTLTGAALVDNDATGVFSTAWPNTMAVCVGGTAASCSDGELALISSCADSKHCTLQSSPGNLTTVPFKTYINNAQLAATAGYAAYLTGVAAQLQ